MGMTSTAQDERQIWARPKPEPFTNKTKTITFQQIDIEEVSIPGHGPQLRVFGVTNEEHSVLAHVHDFLPYFWVAAPRGFSNDMCKDFGIYLNVRSLMS